MKEKNRVEVLLEVVRSQYKTIKEGLDGLQDVPEELKEVTLRLQHIETDVSVIKQVIKDHSRDILDIKSGRNR